MDVEEYAKMWTKPFRFVLGPLPADVEALNAQGVLHHPYRFMGVRYFVCAIPEDVLPQVVEKMLGAGVPIVDPFPDETEEEALQHFWTDRLNEFALIPTQPGSLVTHEIYQLYPPETPLIPVTAQEYQTIVDHMLAAGAKIIPSIPDG
jgi:hypothetical protein